MLTTEREIKSRNERYGAFESKPEKMMAQIGFVEEKNNAVQSFNNIRSVDSYSTDFDMQTSVKYGAIIKPATKRLNVSDAYVEKAKSEKNLTAGVAPRDRVRFKNVAMICAYVLVVAALIAVIVLNSSAISSVSSMNAKLSSIQNHQPDGKAFSAVEKVEKFIQELSDGIGEYPIALKLLSQLNRDKSRGNNRLTVNDLKGSSAIEQEADYIAFLQQTEKTEADVFGIDFYAVKTRSGASRWNKKIVFDKNIGKMSRILGKYEQL